MIGGDITKQGMKPPIRHLAILCGLASLLVIPLRIRGNVYATDIRVNGSFSPAVLLPSNSVAISYILNDTATAGVTIQIESGTNVVKTFSSANGAAGTNAGLNSVLWDGSTDTTNLVSEGAYTVNITAASTGYPCWTNITDDSARFHVDDPRGIVVNNNTNSPYYGRVFVANTYTQFGIFKYNADGSPADEGGFSTGGLTWGQGTPYPKFSPWKMAISEDDLVYIDDFSDEGVLYAFDQTIATNNYQIAIGPGNYPAQDSTPELSGVAVTGSGTNTVIYMTDENPGTSAGIVSWRAATNGVAANNDLGAIVVTTNQEYLSKAPYDLAVDTNGEIYPIQFVLPSDDPAYELLSFPPFSGATEMNADWAVSMRPALLDAYGVAVDPTANYVCVAVVGSGDIETSPSGGLYVFHAADGDLDRQVDSKRPAAYYDAAWDNVGNLYALDGTEEVWRAYSPPGANQATTVGAPVIQFYNAITPPCLCRPAGDPDEIHFTLVGQSNVTYIIQKSCNLNSTNWVNTATNLSPSAQRTIALPMDGTHDFYRAVARP